MYLILTKHRYVRIVVKSPTQAQGLYHSYIIRIPFVYHSYTIRIPFVYHSYTIRIPFVYHSYTIRIPFVYHSYTIRISFVYHWYIRISFVYSYIIRFSQKCSSGIICPYFWIVHLVVENKRENWEKDVSLHVSGWSISSQIIGKHYGYVFTRKDKVKVQKYCIYPVIHVNNSGAAILTQQHLPCNTCK